MKAKQQLNADIKRQQAAAEQAATWLIEMQDPDDATKRAFADWLRQSPENIREYIAVKSLWGEMADLPEDPSIQALLDQSLQEDSIINLPKTGHVGTAVTSPRSTPRQYIWLVAASVLLCLLLTTFWIGPVSPHNIYTTGVGEQKSIPLNDGTIVTLNTRTRLKINYSEQHRDVELLDGEALFEVAKDTSRPFRVITDNSIARAVGTQFNVRKRVQETTVTVVEGIVDVNLLARNANDPTRQPGRGTPDKAVVQHDKSGPQHSATVRLTVGQEALVQGHDKQIQVTHNSTDKVLSWRERRLIFNADTLKAVVAEFNRYNEIPLEIRDAELEPLRISGVFHSNDRESFVAFLVTTDIARVEKRKDGKIELFTPEKS